MNANKNILVMGVGRSGTTAVYTFLQQVLEEQFPGKVDYVYEPFLWDRETFNKLRKSVANEFSLIDSISVDGVYHHKRIPMFAASRVGVPTDSIDWLVETLTPRRGKDHYLGKMIRANGRVGLIREIAPNTKIVFVIRNPLDVMNSAIQLFSFFGVEFHKSDYERFQEELIKQMGGQLNTIQGGLDYVQREYSYWYHSNKAFLEFASRHPANIFSFAYELYTENNSELLERLCRFLDLDYRDDYSKMAANPVGPVRKGVNGLEKLEFEFLSNKLSDYTQLLNFVQETPSVPTNSLPKTMGWRIGAREAAVEPQLNAYSASKALKEKIKEFERVNGALTNELDKIYSLRRYRLVNKILSPLDRFKSRVRAKKSVTKVTK